MGIYILYIFKDKFLRERTSKYSPVSSNQQIDWNTLKTCIHSGKVPMLYTAGAKHIFLITLKIVRDSYFSCCCIFVFL